MRAKRRERAELGRIKRIFVEEVSLKEWVGFGGEEMGKRKNQASDDG